jgi:hypothetical protein
MDVRYLRTSWDWNNETTESKESKHINCGSTAVMCPTVISLSQTTNSKADESQKVSGGGGGENLGKEDSPRGAKTRGKDNDENPGDPSRDSDHGSGHPD